MFGSSGSSFGSSTFGGFNQTPAQPAQSGGLFGTKPAFGATTNTFGATPSATFGTTATTGGLFGAKPAASTSLFGAPAATNTFGNTSAFGQSAPTANTSFGGSSLFGGTAASSSGGLFGGTTSTFGAKTSSFGGTGATTSLFGGTTGTFGATQQQGTNIKYACVQSTDTISNKGLTKTIQTSLHSISCMKEYEAKCAEELRCEDYGLGRKGPQAGAPAVAAAPASTGGLFGSTPAATPSAFGFGQTSTASTGGLFGGTASTGFGAAAAKPAGGLFGSTAAAPATGGLFGAPASTSNAFGGSTFGATSTASTFGQPSGGLFGSTAAKPTTGLFGSTAAPAATGGLFGATTPAFGTTPASTASTGLFGATQPSTGLFGSTAAPATGGLFGATAAKPTFGGFGQTSAATPAFGSTATSNLFGGTAAAKPTFSLGGTTGGTGLFGGAASTGFGGATTAGTGLFGGTAAAKPSLFGNTTLGGAASGGLFGGTSAFGGGTATLGGAQQPVLGASLDSSHIHSVVAALSATPFGDSPLFRTAKDDYKKINPASPATASTGNSKSRITAKPSRVRPKPLSNGYNQLFEGLEDDISPSPEAFLPRNSLKKLVLQSARYHDDVPDILDIPSKCEESEDTPIEEEEQPQIIQTVSQISAAPETLDTTEPENRSITPIRMSPMRKIPFNINESTIQEAPPVETTEEMPENITLCKTEQIEEIQEEIEEPILGLDGKPLKAPPPTLPFTLERPEYYTVPGPDELLDMIRDESLVVRDLIVGRTGYGEVKFLGELDLWGLDLDSTIHFRRKEITVYPDDSVKPPQGQGLNRKSEVTLEAVYPLSKGTRENITDPAQIIKMGYPAKIEKITFKMGAKFMEYQPDKGRWTFMVKHFSQYGLLDSEEEEEEENVKRIKEEEPVSPGDDKTNVLDDSNILSYNEQHDGTMCDSDDDNNSPAKFVPRDMPEEYKGYKAGLFGMGDSDVEEEEEEDEEEKFVQGNQFNFSSTSLSQRKGPILKTALKMEKLDVQGNLNMSNVTEKTTEATPEKKCSVVPSLLLLPPHSQSVARAKGGLNMDEGLVRGHSFRVGWTPDGTVITRQNAQRRKTKVLESHSNDSLCLEGFAVSCGTEVTHHVDLLEVQLEHTTFENRNGVIEAIPNEGPACLEALISKLEEKDDKSVLKSALNLVNALWGRGQDKPGPYSHQMFRRSSLSKWLSSQLRVVAEKRTLEYSKLQSCHLPAVLAWLCGGGIKEAAEILCKAGDYQLALLVSQSSTPIVRQLLLKQLHEWRETGYDAMISSDRLKVYVLLSGEQQWESSTKTINICEGLDWLSSFALYLQYLPPSAPLEDAVISFQESYTAGTAVAPVVMSGKVSVFWQLILLYCNHAHPLAEVFNIEGITSNVLDQREVWHLWHVLISLGLPLPPHALSTQLIQASAGQLERLGLWEWALFLLHHLPLPSARDLSTRHLIYRAVQGHSCPLKEKFCNTRLHIPLNMFDLARAQLAVYKHRWSEAVLSFILAGDSTSAHDIFMDKIAACSILTRDEGSLIPLLDPLHKCSNEISDWCSKGGVYYAYLSLPSTLPQSEEDLDELRSKVSSLGHALNALPFTTITEQCAVTMMGLRVANMLLEIWKKLFGEQDKRELLLTLSSFPLPVDYEINDVITKLSGQIMGEENFEMVA